MAERMSFFIVALLLSSVSVEMLTSAFCACPCSAGRLLHEDLEHFACRQHLRSARRLLGVEGLGVIAQRSAAVRAGGRPAGQFFALFDRPAAGGTGTLEHARLLA